MRGFLRQRKAMLVIAVACAVLALLLWLPHGIVSKGGWNGLQVTWCCLAVGSALFAVLAQFPRREAVDIELTTLGSISFQISDGETDTHGTCRVEADLALVPVQESWPIGQPLVKLCVPSVSPDRSSDCRIAAAEREWISEDCEIRPFEIVATEQYGARELAVVLQLPAGNPEGAIAHLVTWRQSDNDSPLQGIPHKEIDVKGNGKIEVLVTRGPVALLRTATIEHGFVIIHEGKPPQTYIRLDTALGKTLYAPPYWPEDWTDACLDASGGDTLRVWREFGGDASTWQHEYKRQVRFGRASVNRPTLVILGDACVVKVNGRRAYATEKPFVLVLTKYTHDPCFCTHGFPYLTLVGARRDPGVQPWVAGIERWETGTPMPARVTISHSKGQLRIGKAGASVRFEDYGSVSAEVPAPYLAVRPMNPNEYVMRAASDDVRLNGRRIVRSFWTTWPEAVHWFVYGVLTLFWLPILQYITRAVWGQ